jgi:hypothetical protein
VQSTVRQVIRNEAGGKTGSGDGTLKRPYQRVGPAVQQSDSIFGSALYIPRPGGIERVLGGSGWVGLRTIDVLARYPQIVQSAVIQFEQGLQRDPAGSCGARLGNPAHEGGKWIRGRGGRK